MADEQNDLQLLEKVLLRLAVAEDAQLEKQLSSLLVPVISKLASSHETVRKKVLEILSHINKRVKPMTSIKLPLKDLLEQFNDASSNAFMLNFNIIYLEMAFGRSTAQERASVIPQLLSNISKRGAAQQDTLLHMAISAIEHVSIPGDDTERENKFPFAKNDSDTKIILDFFMEVLLCVPIFSNQPQDEGPPGMSLKQYKRVMGKILTVDNLRERKNGILDFLTKSRIFNDSLVTAHFIIASCDNHHAVVKKGEDGLKRLKLNLEDKQLISRLFTLYKGVMGDSVAPEDKRKPVNIILKNKILTYLARSTLAANMFPTTLEVIFDSVYGQEATIKSKQAAMSFVQWVFRMANDDQIKTMGPIILSGLLKLIDQVKSENADTETSQLKGFTYQAIGLLSKRVPQLFSKDFSILTLFFESLAKEDQRVKSSIQEGLTMMCPAYVNPSTEMSQQIEQLLLEHAAKTDYQSRFVALYYTNRLFPFNHISSRYLCATLVEDSKLEIKEEALRGLRPFIYRDGDIVPEPKAIYPEFIPMTNYIWQKFDEKMQARAINNSRILVYTTVVYEEILKFVRTCLQVAAATQEKEIRVYVDGLLKNEDTKKVIFQYLGLVDEALSGSSGLHHVAITSLIEAISHGRDQLTTHYAEKYSWLKSLLYVGALESREIAAKILGMVAPKIESSNLITLINELDNHVRNEASVGFDKLFGGVNALGYIIGLCGQQGVTVPHEIVRNSLFHISTALLSLSSNNNILAACIQSLGMIGRYVRLPIDDSGPEKPDSKETLNKKALIIQIGKFLENSEHKLIERASTAFANISLGETNLDLKKQMIQLIYGVGMNKSEEIHFTAGEALSCLGAGWESLAANDPLLDATKRSKDENSSLLSEVLSQILTKYLPSPRSRGGASIWLLSIVKNTGTHPAVYSQLQKIQSVFSFLLSDGNEVIQEVAAKGLVYVHELGDENTKKELVNNLLETLSSGKKSGFKLEGESEILSDQTLGKAPDNSGVSTYKELCSLASDLGQPELVYKFLNLSSHHALWNSKKGAAFAATTIMTQSRDQLEKFLPVLVPRLYRYSFDPNPKIAASMNNILKAIEGTDGRKLVTEYFAKIMKELIEGLDSSQWRVREASANAISEAFQGRNFDEVKPFLGDVWYLLFRAVDDIKETVRNAANNALKTVSNLTTRLCDPTHTSTAQGKEAINIALPFLMQKGIVHSVQEVRAFSLAQILKIAKVAGFLLRPHVPDLVGVLLEGLSAFENPNNNYLSFHTASMNVSVEQFEEARLTISKMTPMNDTLDICVKHVDSANAENLVRKLMEVIKTGVGLPTRVGVAKFITQLTYTKSEELKPYSDRLLIALLMPLKDKSPSVRKSFAGALGNIAQFAPQKAVKQVTDNLMELSVDSENDDSRMTSATAFLELAKRANLAIKPFYNEILPMVFIAKHDPNEEIGKVFKSVWDECSVGGVKAYLPDILKYITKAMESQSWIMKKQAGLTLKETAENVGDALSDHLDVVLKLIISNMPGRLWKGKESLLSALSSICSACTREILKGGNGHESPKSIVETVLKETKKNDREYKRIAIQTLGNILKTFSEVDLYEVVKSQIFAIAKGEDVGTDEGEMKDKPLTLLIRAAAFQALGHSWPSVYSTQFKYGNEIAELLTKQYLQNIWNVRVEILICMKVFVQRIAEENSQPSVLTPSIIKDILGVCYEAMSDNKYSVLRSGALDVVQQLVLKTEGTPLLDAHLSEMTTQLTALSALDDVLKDSSERIKQSLIEHPSKKRKNV